ncbi:cupin domain-containing protein [Thermoproteota archaeon]
MKYTNIFADEKGETHFKDVKIELESVVFAPPAPAFMVSQFRPATQFAFTLFPSGWFGDWHPAPRKLVYFILSGELECIVSDGERRIFGSGSIVLVEDTTGMGHVTRVEGSEDVITAVVQVDN